MFSWLLQPEVYWFVPGMIWPSASLYSKCTVFTVNICCLQVSAMYKKVLSLILFDFKWHNNVLHFSVTKIFGQSVESGTSEKVLQ